MTLAIPLTGLSRYIEMVAVRLLIGLVTHTLVKPSARNMLSHPMLLIDRHIIESRQGEETRNRSRDVRSLPLKEIADGIH